jgi:subtilisin family serine protease
MNARRSFSAIVAVVALTVSTVVGVSPSSAKAVAVAPAQLIVQIDPARTTIAAINAAAGTTTAATSGGAAGSFLLNVAPDANIDTVAAAIAALPGVLFVEPNVKVNPPEVAASSLFSLGGRMYFWSAGAPLPAESQYATAAVSLAGAQAISTGAGVVVAVLDNGAQLDHTQLAGSIVSGVDFVDGGTPAETANGADDDGDGLIDEGVGHGTFVAGIVHQVAPLAKIMPVRVLDDDGSGTSWAVSEGLYWAAQHGARVISSSLGGHSSMNIVKQTTKAVIASGVTIVGAAGNEALERTMFPGAVPDAISVGSVGASDKVSAFSNFGAWIDVVAPGENVFSTFPGNRNAIASGTSMSTPWVAGAAALLLSKNPGLTPAGVATAVRAGAKNINALNPGKAGKLGGGRIDLVASLKLV